MAPIRPAEDSPVQSIEANVAVDTLNATISFNPPRNTSNQASQASEPEVDLDLVDDPPSVPTPSDKYFHSCENYDSVADLSTNLEDGLGVDEAMLMEMLYFTAEGSPVEVATPTVQASNRTSGLAICLWRSWLQKRNPSQSSDDIATSTAAVDPSQPPTSDARSSLAARDGRHGSLERYSLSLAFGSPKSSFKNIIDRTMEEGSSSMFTAQVDHGHEPVDDQVPATFHYGGRREEKSGLWHEHDSDAFAWSPHGFW
ncbi:hypothetical protein CONLIGDRAFT_650663 [Coniochaeta ligniaria NRRL 30616]|uniref:Uncharacterized protein n=1 Tax=Coniochaeta ligniaria NRRL 30616 TaxID=1408157 RepID=A0A1J7I4J7_9PEZI|nr:hypothetical protein CONLIGDRAFT_650663 [Coniochaeta ligniaria NRRL 30616]